MRVVVLSIGSELLRGDIIDTNAAFLTRRLSQLGFDVRRVEQVGDNLADLQQVVASALSLADVVVCTGGLGPTQDDLTRQAIAGALGEELYHDPESVRQIEERFAAMGRRMPASNRQQALLIPSAAAIPNPHGTAPGWLVEKEGRMIVAMPGPPSEMQPMWRDSVQPRLEHMLSGKTAMRSLMTFGLGESAVEERIEEVIRWRPDVIVATYAKSSGVEVHVTAQAGSLEEAEHLARQAEQQLRERLGESIFGESEETLSSAVGTMLLERGLTLAVMESATGGELASMITNSPGSSSYFVGGVVAYTREAKAAFGVAAEVMDANGLISAETALAMAAAARDRFGADIGLGATGVAGMEPVEGHPPGTVFLAVTLEGREEARQITRPGTREVVKRFAAQSALDLLRRQLRARERAQV